jgi:diaminopimelate epimerase
MMRIPTAEEQDMTIHFTKMHGLGNDFMVIDAINQTVELSPQQIKLWADRHFGIGFDQLLIVEPPKTADTLFTYRIFNADGGEVEQCGNGARCFARYVHDKGLTDAKEIPVGTAGGRIVLYITASGDVTVDMGHPVFNPADIPFISNHQAADYTLTLNDGSLWQVDVLSMGNPHAVLEVENIETAPVSHIGPIIEHHPQFPNRVNVGFMQIIDRQHIRLRVFERGSGETLACGTGACAAVVSGIRRHRLDSPCFVDVQGGRLSVAWAGQPEDTVFMTGPAQSVFEGQVTTT